MPSFQGSQRRDVRRRLAAAGTAAMHATDPETTTAKREPSRKVGVYAQKALPEHHASPAERIPVRPLPFLAAATGLLVVPSALAGLAVAHPHVATLQASLGPRWANSAETVRSLIALESPHGLAATAGLACFLLASALAAATRTMRRHRLDDHQGRYRAWGWLGGLFAAAAVGMLLPLDRLTGTLMAEATGWEFGAGGRGWWMLLVALAWLPIGLWAVLPLTQRFATSFWLTGSLASWLAAEGVGQALAAGWQPSLWQLGEPAPWQLAATILHVFTPALAAIGMLVASRSVIREARGLIEPRAPRVRRPRRAKQPVTTEKTAVADTTATPDSDRKETEDTADQTTPTYEEDAWEDDTAEQAEEPPIAAPAPQLLENGDSIDDDSSTGPDHEGHATDEGRLSKAERRRLRKLARKNRAA